MGFLAAFLLPVFHGTCNIIGGQLSTKEFKSPITLLFYLRMTYVIAILAFLLIFGFPQIPTVGIITLIVIAGLLDILAAIPFLTAYKHADTSIVGAYLSLGKIFKPIVAFALLGELLSPFQYLGFLVIIVANVILGTRDFRKFKINKGFYLMLIVAILSAFQVALLKRASLAMDAESTTFYFVTLRCVLPLLFLLNRNRRVDIRKNLPIYRSLFPLFIIIAAFSTAGWFASNYANYMLPIVIVSAINSLRPLFILSVGLVADKLFHRSLNEKLSRNETIKKLLCFTLIVIGVYIAIGI